MKHAILFGVIGFVVSLAATTGYLVKKHPTPPAAGAPAGTDSTRVDSTATPRDSTSAKNDSNPSRRDSLPTKAVGDAATDAVPPRPAAALDSSRGSGDPTARPTAATGASDNPPGPASNPALRAQAFKQVARVLSAMKPPEAAKVLAFLSDSEVEGILRAVGPRQAADFMTNLPKERAATLSRRLLVVKPKDSPL